jgi:DNA-binding NarL/FixJ family response regulator
MQLLFDQDMRMNADNAATAPAARFESQSNDDGASRSDALPRAARNMVLLIDPHNFSRGCLELLLERCLPGSAVRSFADPVDCLDPGDGDVRLVVYTSHSADVADAACFREMSLLHAAFPLTPIVVLFEAQYIESSHVQALCDFGVRALVSTRTTSAATAVAAINLALTGGCYVPTSLLAAVQVAAEPGERPLLTSRQSDVFRELRQGKSNKIIAHELGMSESTVKVHVRNIMRKMGATNRTQAVFKAQDMQLSEFAFPG